MMISVLNRLMTYLSYFLVAGDSVLMHVSGLDVNGDIWESSQKEGEN